MAKVKTEATKTISTRLKRALTPTSKWTGTKDELLDAFYWVRQILGLLIGIGLGISGLTGGIIGFMTFFAVSTVISFLYARVYLGSQDEIDSGELFQEGLVGSIGFFLSSWVITYTLLN